MNNGKIKGITKSLGAKEHPAYNNMMSNSTGHILCRNCLLKHLTEGTIEGWEDKEDVGN
jgi:hypothetical protein